MKCKEIYIKLFSVTKIFKMDLTKMIILTGHQILP